MDSLEKEFIAVVLWFVWRARNNAIFRAKTPNPNTIVDLAQAHLQNFSRWKNKNMAKKIRDPNLQRRWRPSERGSLKLNVDGSWVEGEHVGSVAGILWDQDGQVLDVFARDVRASSPAQVETLAILHGLELLQFRKELHVGKAATGQVQIGKVECEIDSLIAMQSIMGWAESPWNVKPIIEQCKGILSISKSMTMVHCSREANKAADWLVKAHRTKSLPENWKSYPPSVLSEILCSECYLSSSCKSSMF
ncbi:hypothetical protein ACJRO7_032068 [Eucalyptus globulus]|uniref:RNase H type-1 domain-containing protein n=1 Tax=Eucalyptus globulus TaxID=34317 RepID=A0ABD3JIR0_EUCGL